MFDNKNIIIFRTEILSRRMPDLENIDCPNITIISEEVEPRVSYFAKLSPDLFIIDIHLFPSSGISQIIKLRTQNTIHNNVPIIFSSWYDCVDWRKACNEMGVEYRINKLSDTDRINEILRELWSK